MEIGKIVLVKGVGHGVLIKANSDFCFVRLFNGDKLITAPIEMVTTEGIDDDDTH